MARPLTTDDIKQINELVEAVNALKTWTLAMDDGLGINPPWQVSIATLAKLLVPFNGATNDLDLNGHDVKALKGFFDTLRLTVNPANVPTEAGAVYYDAVDNCYNVVLPSSEVQTLAYLSDVSDIGIALSNHMGDTENPHGVTKEQVGLGKVANKTEAEMVADGAIKDALALKETVLNVDTLKGTDWAGETVKGNADDIATLNDDATTEGSVLKSIKEQAQKGDFAPTVASGIESETLEEAVNEVGVDVEAVKGTDWAGETVKGNAEDIATLNGDDSTEGSVAYDIKQLSDALKGVDYTEGSLKTHEDRLDTLEGADTVSGSVAKTVKDTAQDATFTDASGLDSTTLKDAINEIYAEKAVANGLASLDATGKIPVAQLPVSAMEFKGGWDASSGAYPLTPDVGDFWTVSVAGTTEGVKFDAGDAIVYNGATWDKINKVEIAEEVSYDNSSSGLIATNVQDAIDEVEGRIDDAETALTTLNGDDTTAGSVLKSIKEQAQKGDFAPTVASGIASTSIEEAVNEVGSRVTSLEAYNPINSWQNIQEILRQGRIKQYLSVGDQFLAEYNSVPTIFNVIGIDHPGLVPTDPRFTHTLALQPQDCLMNAQFSAPQAIYGSTEELPAGTYIFTLNGVQYTFTSTESMPANGVLVGGGWTDYVPSTITIYGANRRDVIESGLAVTPTTGTDTLTTINDHIRCRYGSNNPVDNAMRQFLNSNTAVFNWEPQGLYDMPSSYSGTGGFLYQLDPELVAVMGEVENKVALSTYDGGGQVTVQDKAFLLSRVEVGLGSEGFTTGESVYEFYDGVSDANRIKLLSGSPSYWWLRSPRIGNTYYTRLVSPSGTLDHGSAYGAYGLSPACVIW